MNVWSRRRMALCLAVGAGLGLLGGHGALRAHTPAGGLDLQLIDRERGTPLPRYASQGLQFSPGREGGRYAIRLRNWGSERLLVVLSVDGINAITGDTAAWSQSGYVLEPGETADITGWRKSDRQVAAFEFAALADSYAARTGRPDHVGVVGAAVFREQAPPLVASGSPGGARGQAAPQLDRLAEAAAATGRDAAPADRGRVAGAPLGTGHGRSELAPIQYTEFQRRSSQPEQVLEIHYDSPARLMAAGIMPRPVTQRPQSFPGSGQFVPDPPVR